jgi:thioredoxin:protein disulfide reductase
MERELARIHRESLRPRPASRAAAAMVAIAIVVASLAPAALAAPPKPGQIVGITRVRLALPLEPGRTSILKIDALVLTGWHINSDRPLNPDYIATRLRVSAPAGITVGTVSYPPPEIRTLGFSGGEKLSVWTGALYFEVPLSAGADFKAAAGQELTVTIGYQACNDSQCLRPASIGSTLALGSLEAAGAEGVANNRGGAAGVAPERAPALGEGAIANVFAHHGWVLGFLAVLLGGLALNLTPCVYPLIGVTIAYFGNQGGGPRRVLILAITYVLGIALMFSAVGVAVALSGGLFGAAMQNPIVLSAIAAVLVMLALSSFGVFVLQPPQFMMRWAGAARPGFAGALVMGLGMGVVAAPCIGPIVLGLLLMVEKSGSALLGFALFFTLAIGLGLPYVGLALAAGSIRRLPRAGEWLAWVEQLFGFILIGLAIYFLDPVVPRHLMTRVLPFYAAGVGIYLGFITRAGRNWRPFLVIRSALGVVAVAALIWLAIPRRGPAQVVFAPFDPSALQSATAERRPVLIDFRADWCIPCREMEHSTFIDPSVVKEAQRFVRMRADLTHQDPQSLAIVSKYAIQGVPTTLIIDSRGRIQVRKVGYVGPGELVADLRGVD